MDAATLEADEKRKELKGKKKGTTGLSLLFYLTTTQPAPAFYV